MAGELNGTDVGVALDSNGNGTFVDLGGIISNSFTLNNGAIDITNKSSASWRELLSGKGLQSAEISIECIFSSDLVFGQIKAISGTKEYKDFRIARGAAIINGEYMVSSFAETAPDNDKLTATFTLMSNGATTGI
jgi:predicted secreted protein|tara:strand:+ start:2741 stop:3145 length:405 start_codon:yes stop_codon:yes gene_type:complete